MISDGNENIFFALVSYDLNLLTYSLKLVDRQTEVVCMQMLHVNAQHNVPGYRDKLLSLGSCFIIYF